LLSALPSKKAEPGSLIVLREVAATTPSTLFKRPCNLFFSVGSSTTLLARFLSSPTVPLTCIAVDLSVGASFVLLADVTPTLLELVALELDCALEVVAVGVSDDEVE
jgi:hypothetical protein